MLKTVISKIFCGNTIHLHPSTVTTKNALVSYITVPFQKEIHDIFHSNVYECRIIVECLLKMGYNVDIINWNNYQFIPKKKYEIFIDIHNNIDRLHSLLGKSTIKILYVTGAHWAYQNHAEYSRLLDVQNRKTVSLLPRRIASPCRSIEYADYAIVLGEKTAYESFQYAKKPLYPIDLLSIISYKWIENKDFKTSRNRFLWIGGSGLVHKGLDLVLDVFSKLKDLELYICGNISNEPDFEILYHRELYQTENIHYLGWININNDLFIDILRSCGTVVFPSCSESQSISVITCLHGGLIPIISRQCGLNVEEFGIELKSCSIEEITNAVITISKIEPDLFEQRAKKSWEYARKNHTTENYSEKMMSILRNINRIKPN